MRCSFFYKHCDVVTLFNSVYNPGIAIIVYMSGFWSKREEKTFSGFSLSYRKLNCSVLGMLSLFVSLEQIMCDDFVMCLERSLRLILSVLPAFYI